MSRKWDNRWMDTALHFANLSGDQSTKTAAVIVDDRNNLLAVGWNDLPRGVGEAQYRRERPAKYDWTEHAERNAIYNAAASSANVRGATMYTLWYPCPDCARGIIQSGIKKLVVPEPDYTCERRGAQRALVNKMLFEAGVIVQYIDGYGPIEVKS